MYAMPPHKQSDKIEFFGLRTLHNIIRETF